MIINAVTVSDLWPFLVMAKGPSWEPGTDLLAVQETAADQGGRGDLLMKQFEGFTLRIEGNKVFINREPATPEEKQRLYAAICKAYHGTLDSMARAAIMEEVQKYEK